MRVTTLGKHLACQKSQRGTHSVSRYTTPGRFPNAGASCNPLLYRVKTPVRAVTRRPGHQSSKAVTYQMTVAKASPRRAGEGKGSDAARHFWPAHQALREGFGQTPRVPRARRLGEKKSGEPEGSPDRCSPAGPLGIASINRCGRSTARSES